MPKALTVNAKDFASKTSPTSGIQEAIDALPKSGGTVLLPAGTYKLRRSVRLRSNLILRGEGGATVLTRGPLQYWDLAKSILKKGQPFVDVKNAKGLSAGDEILIGSLHEHGWSCRHGVVRGVKKNRVALEIVAGPLECTYLMDDHPIIGNWFPALHAVEAKDLCIEQLTIDGKIRKHKRLKTDFTCSAVHTHRCLDVRVLNINVRNWPGDGIGIQSGENALIQGCTVENCCGPGLHPGTGLANSQWLDNVSRRNTKDGYFFCMNVTQAVCKGNLFYANGWNGIGGLTMPDRYNIVADNVIAFNRQHGIHAPQSVGNTIQGNLLRNNSQEKAGQFPAIYLDQHRSNIVRNNLCVDDQEKRTQTVGVVEKDPAGENVVADNPVFLDEPRKPKPKK